MQDVTWGSGIGVVETWDEKIVVSVLNFYPNLGQVCQFSKLELEYTLISNIDFNGCLYSCN